MTSSTTLKFSAGAQVGASDRQGLITLSIVEADQAVYVHLPRPAAMRLLRALEAQLFPSNVVPIADSQAFRIAHNIPEAS